jgi:diguanylate cyclase (GGDEF)-like protein
MKDEGKTKEQLIRELEELRKRYVELEAMVKERTKQLEAANRKLRRLSTIDTLTGIANRRSFNEAFEKEWRRCIRSGKPLSLIMADIDFFKDYNDHYGHLEGDTCLKKVAGALKRVLKRSGDFLARYGGEEFVALLPDTDSQGASLVAEAMFYNVKALDMPHTYSSVSERVTVSFGLATIVPLIDVKSSTLIKAADDALYEAKKQGRNRIEMQN